MTTMLFDTTHERSKLITHLAICILAGILGIGAYLYATTLGVNYTRERDNIGNTYCLYWTPFSTRTFWCSCAKFSRGSVKRAAG